MDLNIENTNSNIDLNYSFIKETYLKDDETKKKHQIQRIFKFPSTFEEVASIRFSPHGDSLAVGYATGDIQEISTTGNLLWTVDSKHRGVKCLRYTVKSPYLISCDGEGEIYFHSGAGGGSFRFGEENFVSTLNVSHDDRNIITGNYTGAVNVMDTSKGRVVHAYKENPLRLNRKIFHNMEITNITLMPNNDLFLTSALDCHVKMWDPKVKYPVKQIRGPYIVGDCLDVSSEVKTKN